MYSPTKNNKDPYKGKYKQLNMIGKGKFGIVYLVKSLQDDKQYVAKHISLENIQEKIAVKELEIIKKLKHPYIIEYIDSFKSNPDFIIIMQNCKQKDLSHHIQLMKKKNKHFNQTLIITWIFQLVLGLQYIHSKKVLHRDIKPQNIFLDQNLNIKIGDFGVSKLLNSTQECSNTTTGTPCYISPQICEQQKYTSKADIWSLGCVIYQLCSLQKPFKGGIFQIFDQIKSGKIKQIPTNLYSTQLKNLVLKMMTRDQSKRPNTVQLLKDPLLVDLMIKNSSSIMSLRKQYNKNIDKSGNTNNESNNVNNNNEKPQNNNNNSPNLLTSSLIDRQTDLVRNQLKLFQQQVKQKMQGIKKNNKQVNNNYLEKHYKQLKQKMAEIENVIGKAFQQLRKKSNGVVQNNSGSNNNPNSNNNKVNNINNLQASIKNSSSLTDSSDMTIIQSVDIDQNFLKNKLKSNQSNILNSKQASMKQSQNNNLFKNKNKIDKIYFQYDSNVLSNIQSVDSQKLIDSDNFSQTYQTINLQSKINNNIKQGNYSNKISRNNLIEQSFDQTLKSQYQQTIKQSLPLQTQNKLAKQTLNKLQFLQKTLSQNPNAILNDSLLNFTLTMSQDQLVGKLKFGKNNFKKTIGNSLQDSINFDLTKRQPIENINGFKKKQNKYQKQVNKDNDQASQYQQQQFQTYDQDFQNYQNQAQQGSQNSQSFSSLKNESILHPNESMKQRRKSQLNTIISFYQQTLQQFNNNQSYLEPESPTKKVKNKYPLVMSQIKQQAGQSIVSKTNNSSSNNSSSRFKLFNQ